MMRKFLLASWLWLAAAVPALANVPCSLPFNLQNGTTADASQVMANYNALVTCLASAAIAGVNNDITQLIGITTPLSPVQGGSNVFIGGTSTGSANAQVVSSTTPSGFALTIGYQVVFKAGFTNSGATTLTVGSTAATNLFKQTNAGPVALTGNEIQAGQIVFAWYDGTQWEMLPPLALTGGFGISISGGTQVSIATTNPPYGFNQPINMALSAAGNTPSANLLQVCVLTNSGATPSASSPVLVPFTNGTGGVTWLSITSSHCINTNGAGASLGTQNNSACSPQNCAFRLWVVEFNNSGTPVLALWHSGAGAATTAIAPLDETTSQTTTAISSAANAAATFYTPNGTTIGGGGAKFKILGFVEYSSGLATAGSYGSSPTKVQLFGPGVRKPGDVVQTVAGTAAQSITPTSTVNPVEVIPTVKVACQANTGATSLTVNLLRASTVIANSSLSMTGISGVTWQQFVSVPWLDTPFTTSSTQYTSNESGPIGCTTASGSTAWQILHEIQG